jgi:predicted nuclease of restriction endonuclease-like (RecB) superfamily
VVYVAFVIDAYAWRILGWRAASSTRDKYERDWYAAAAAEHGWSRNVLLNQITSRLRRRTAAAPSNFEHRLPAADSELAQQLTKDP